MKYKNIKYKLTLKTVKWISENTRKAKKSCKAMFCNMLEKTKQPQRL